MPPSMADVAANRYDAMTIQSSTSSTTTTTTTTKRTSQSSTAQEGDVSAPTVGERKLIAETRTSRERKSVTFAANAKGRKTIHINNYTKEEITNCWFSSKEMREIKSDIRQTVAMLEQNQPIDEIRYSRRGVDIYKKEVWVVRTERKKKAQKAVFKKQMKCLVRATDGDFQQEYEYNDDDARKIAGVYKKANKESVLASYMKGVSMRSEELAGDEVPEMFQLSSDPIATLPSSSSSPLTATAICIEPQGKTIPQNDDCVVGCTTPTMQTTLQKKGRIQMRRNSIVNSAA